MLTKRQLALLRAALQYFDEEFLPHHLDVAKFYFDGPLEAELALIEIRDLRRFLSGCELRYARSDVNSFALLGGDLVEIVEEIQATVIGPSHAIATIIFPRSF